MISEPNPDAPLDIAIAQVKSYALTKYHAFILPTFSFKQYINNRSKYEKTARQWTQRYAMTRSAPQLSVITSTIRSFVHDYPDKHLSLLSWQDVGRDLQALVEAVFPSSVDLRKRRSAMRAVDFLQAQDSAVRFPEFAQYVEGDAVREKLKARVSLKYWSLLVKIFFDYSYSSLDYC